MAGKMLATCRCKRVPSRGFSLVEILIAVSMMAIFMGVTGSLFSGMITSFEISDDQTIARRRAQDVFNILKTPILNAGLGIPSNNMDWYFDLGGAKAPVASWSGPACDDANGTFSGAGNTYRVIYSLRSGGHNGDSEITDFSTKTLGTAYTPQYVSTPVTMSLAASPVPLPPSGSFGIVDGGGGVASPLDMRSFITFPGIHTNPLYVREFRASPGELSLIGKTPVMPAATSGDVLWRNVIQPHHEIYMLRAGVAYVDGDSRFCFTDITTEDYPKDALPSGGDLAAGLADGFVIEGIKAIKFEPAGDRRVVTVRVVAEGDSYITNRKDSVGLRDLERDWSGVTFDHSMYYEEFSMCLRTRNLVDSAH